jgi:peptidoglycan/LPS O-acetylase OafA/YrhL
MPSLSSQSGAARGMTTVKDRMDRTGGFTTGFDYLRIILSISVLTWHSIWISTGSVALDQSIWTGPYRFLPAAILPLFFALSGFLVAGSLLRNRIHQFVTLRVLRLIPALAVEITLSALLVGLVFTTLPAREYLTSRLFFMYFFNIIGHIQYYLPGVFHDNPVQGVVNGQLWTIPYELKCYLALIVLAVLTLVKRPGLFAILVVGFLLAQTAWLYLGHPLATDEHVPGRVLTFSFLAGVAIYLKRDRVPYSHWLGLLSVIAAGALLQFANLSYLAVIPIAYMTVWLGLMRPPAIPFGDLSYGVYLFHFPVEQAIVGAWPQSISWWLLTIIALPLTAICAWLSWNLVEKPTLTRKKFIVGKVDHVWVAMTALINRARLLGKTPPPPGVIPGLDPGTSLRGTRSPGQ